MRELGYVITPARVTYRLFDDDHWEVVHVGRRLTASEASIFATYEDFRDSPANPGLVRLMDLARRTGGEMVWHNPEPDPSVAAVAEP